MEMEKEKKASLWVDKYHPMNIESVIGNGDISKNLLHWLKTWKEQKKKAVILSGPPGIGKKSIAVLCAKKVEYDVVYELNAHNCNNRTISNEKRIIIISETDLVTPDIIKTTQIPIICICNDRYATKIKAIGNHCYDLKMKRPMKSQIASHIIAIAKKEKLSISQKQIEMLIDDAGNDVRQVINALQLQCNYGSGKDKLLRLTPFEVCHQILSGKGTVDDRYNAFFTDSFLVPLLIQENYTNSERNSMDEISAASDAISDLDIAGQYYDLLPVQAMFSVRIKTRSDFPIFPQWLGKNSTTTKIQNKTRDIINRSSIQRSSFCAMRIDYFSYLHSFLLYPLLTLGTKGIRQVIVRLDEMGLNRDDLIDTLHEMQLDNTVQKLDSKVKSALTKQYNCRKK
jgi:replication factor C subunit 1